MTWQSLHEQLEVGMIYATLFPQSSTHEEEIPTTIDLLLHDSFFERIELKDINDKAIRNDIKNRIEISRMKVIYAAQPIVFGKGLNVNSTDEEVRKLAVSELKKSLEDAADFGVEAMTFCSGPMVNEKLYEAMEALEKSIVELDQYAAKLGIKLYLEIFDYDIHRNRLIGSTKNALTIAQRLDGQCTQFSLMVDLSHIPLLHESIEEAVLPLKGYIGYVHIGNCVLQKDDPRYGDLHPYFGYPAGENDVYEVVQFLHSLEKVGYIQPGRKAPLTIEIIAAEGEDQADLIVNAKRTLTQAWDAFLEQKREEKATLEQSNAKALK